MQIDEYIKNNKERFLDELFELIRIPSVSSVSAHEKDMYRAANAWQDILKGLGFDEARIMDTTDYPVVFGQKMLDPALPTIMVYGHYDVMPPDPLDKWISDPFEPEIRDGKIYARGADDDKGQSFMHVKALEYLIKYDKLKCNVKFLVEGEEEIGSPGLQQFCHDHKELLEADVILVSDTTMIALDTPSITVGLRGLTYLEVQVTGPNKDLHSGLFGGAVPNPANILVRMLTSIIDENQRIVIPGFYDDVQQVPGHERNELNRAPFDLAAYTRELDIPDVHGEEGYTTIERTGIRPSFDINGMWSGYTAEGAKTVLPSTAHAKISFRLVPNQDHRKIGKLVARYLDEVAPPSVKVETKVLHGGQAYVAPVSSSAYRAAEKAMEMSLGKKPVPVRSGGSIPIIATFDEVLSTKAILMGFGLESDVIHSPNENFPLENFYKGIEAITRFHENFNG